MYISTTFNGAIIEQTERQVQDGSFVYSLDYVEVSNSFENFDPFDPRDRLVMSFLINGITNDGDRRYAAKVCYTEGGWLYTGDKEYNPIDPETRKERLDDIALEALRDIGETLENIF